MQTRARLTVLFSSLCASSAWAGDTFTIGGDVSAAARWLDNNVFDSPNTFQAPGAPTGWAGALGVRLEVDFLVQGRADLRYVEGKVFKASGDRFVDLSAALSSPALLFLCADVHELYVRSTARPGDGLFYVNGGLGFKGRLLGTLKGSLGLSYLSAEDNTGADRTSAIGAYVGADWVVRVKWVDFSARAAGIAVFHESRPHFGVLADADLMVKIPVGPVALGPRFDLSYRNLGFTSGSDELFGQPEEITLTAGLGVVWGAGD